MRGGAGGSGYRDVAIMLIFLPIMLFCNVQKFARLWLRWTPIMLKLFHNFLHADGGLAFVSRFLVMSVCVGPSVSPRKKQWVADRYM